jgi:hypothetical protein
MKIVGFLRQLPIATGCPWPPKHHDHKMTRPSPLIPSEGKEKDVVERSLHTQHSQLSTPPAPANPITRDTITQKNMEKIG